MTNMNPAREGERAELCAPAERIALQPPRRVGQARGLELALECAAVRRIDSISQDDDDREAKTPP
jgi:hypothetical protein